MRLLTPTTFRPNKYSQQFVDLAIDKYMPDFIKWAEEGASDEVRASFKKDLQRALRYVGAADDGYKIAKDLDHDSGWDADSQLVELLDDLLVEIHNQYDRGIQKWSTDQRPSISIGIKVTVKQFRHFGVGELVNIDWTRLTGTVFYSAAGHVRTGVGTHGYVVDLESIETVDTGYTLISLPIL